MTAATEEKKVPETPQSTSSTPASEETNSNCSSDNLPQYFQTTPAGEAPPQPKPARSRRYTTQPAIRNNSGCGTGWPVAFLLLFFFACTKIRESGGQYKRNGSLILKCAHPHVEDTDSIPRMNTSVCVQHDFESDSSNGTDCITIRPYVNKPLYCTMMLLSSEEFSANATI